MAQMYAFPMDVAVSDLRAHLREWLERAGNGEEIVVTDRGTPIARIVGVGASTTIERLTAEGLSSLPEVAERPRAGDERLIRPRRPVSPYIAEHRR